MHGRPFQVCGFLQTRVVDVGAVRPGSGRVRLLVRPRLGDDREIQWVRSKSRSHRYPDIRTRDNLVQVLVPRSCPKVTY